jgi:hypothetical protein
MLETQKVHLYCRFRRGGDSHFGNRFTPLRNHANQSMVLKGFQTPQAPSTLSLSSYGILIICNPFIVFDSLKSHRLSSTHRFPNQARSSPYQFTASILEGLSPFFKPNDPPRSMIPLIEHGRLYMGLFGPLNSLRLSMSLLERRG